MGDRVGWNRACRMAGVAAACVALLALVGGCGSSDEQASARPAPAPPHVAKEIAVSADRWAYARARFNEMCSGCHTLADARATGRRFNLDRVPNLNQDLVRFAIRDGEPGMPAWGHVLSRREFQELAAYVLAVARREEGDDGWGYQYNLRHEGDVWQPGDPR